MVLYLFLLPILLERKDKQAFSYSALYDRLPLAASTVRGIVASFLERGFLELVGTDADHRFQMTKKGIVEASSVFPSLPRQESDAVTMIIVPPQSSDSSYAMLRPLESLGFFPIRSGVFLRFGDFHIKELQVLPKSIRSTLLVCQNIAITQLEGADTIIDTFSGREFCLPRSQTYGLLRQLYAARTKKNFRGAKKYVSLLKMSYEVIISVLQRNYRIPEEYLPQNSRLSNLNRLFWTAII